MKGWFALEQSDIAEIETLPNFVDNLIDYNNFLYVRNQNYDYCSHDIQNFTKITFGNIRKSTLRLIEALKINATSQEIITAIENFLEKNKYDVLTISEQDSKEFIQLLEKSELKIDEDNDKEINRIAELTQLAKKNIFYGELLGFLNKKLPKFIYFNNYIKVKPLIHLQQLADRQERQTIDDKYYDYGNLSLLKFLGYTPRELSNLGVENNSTDTDEFRKKRDERQYKLNASSIRLTNSITEIWNPNNSKDEASQLRVIADGQYLKVAVTDRLGAEIELDQRSEGFQWMISFFIVFESQADNDYKNCILLLDEPATSLHALKQKEFIKTISKLAEKNQTIYTTHSPFMISQDELDLVRIVELTDRAIGTKVNNTIISNDPAALFPLQEALGYNLAQSMFTAKKNVLLEGLTDLWYLEGINSLFDKNLDQNIALLPVGTSAKISYYASMLSNNDLKTVALLDSDSAGDKTAQQETVVHALGTKNILRTKEFLSREIRNSEIEDIIRETLASIFSAEYTIQITAEELVSDKAIVDIFKKKDPKFSKFKLSKAFLNWAREHSAKDLTQEEITNCEKLIDIINRRLK
ncbi:AAA family ATPase [Acinetobacter sp. Marseille-Q1618]|uniref:AAA family ATPase n=1 Tax=Acinetobacter sp. Marseille-Q1618 TaxID=2697502 RepID=UPI0020C215FE|nr:AAA family ATPase [Acinetobacter sp. Marseille-Q1618]